MDSRLRYETGGVCLRLLQNNCHGMYEAMSDLSECVRENGLQVCMFQEPYVSFGGVRGLPSGTRVAVSESGLAAVALFDEGYECMTIEECKFIDGACMWIKGETGELYVVSLYFRPKKPMDDCLNFLEKVCTMANGKRVIVGMDANAASDLWHSKNVGRSPEATSRGQKLEDWLDGKDWLILNQPADAYSFSGARGQSDVDVSMYMGVTHDCEFEWFLMDDWGISDHNPIVIKMRVNEHSAYENKAKKWNDRECDWEEYKELIASAANDFGYKRFMKLKAEERVDKMYEWIEAANDVCMKRLKSKWRKRGLVWWTKELSEKRKEVRRKRKRYQRERGRTGDVDRVKWKEWKASAKEYKAMIKEVKEKDWQEFVRRESDRDPWGKVYRICMGKARQGLTSLRTQDGWTHSWAESAQVLLDEFFPCDDGVPIPTGPRSADRVRVNEFSMEEVRNAVVRMKMGKSPGMDGITNRMIKCVWQAIPRFMRGMFNGCMNEGLFPQRWKEARVVTLLKSADKDPTEPRSYRPISLVCGFGKVQERMMVARLMHHMKDKWNERQYGFMEGKCTEDAWEYMKTCVNESEYKHVMGAFVDFKGAFDYLLWRIALAGLERAGCKPDEMRLWRDYFKDRMVYMCSNADTISKRVSRGCPQGSIGGPPIWNLGINELLDELCDAGVKCVAYADDLTILIEGNTRKELEEKASVVLKIVYAWGKRVGVDVSDSKTVCMILKGGLQMTNRVIHVPLDEEDVRNIKCVDQVRYLGVNMGVNMDFRVHVNGMRKRVEGMIGKLRRVMRKDWGLRKNVVCVLIKGLILPAIMYACSVWYEQVKWKGVCSELLVCQRRVLYACTRVCRTVSTEAMQIIAGSLPWDIECKRQAARYKVRKRMRMNDLDLVTNEEVDGLEVNAAKEFVDVRAREVWQVRWDNSANGRVTYEWIKDVRFSERTPKFEPSLRAGYLLTGHGSLNAFLFSRALSPSSACLCGHPREDWVHVLCHCSMYGEFRDLNAMNVTRNGNEWDVSKVLNAKETYDRLCEFADRAFKVREEANARRNEGGE